MGCAGHRAVFLDRDDTLIRNIPYLADPSRIELLPGAAGAVQRLRDAGFKLFLFTNQSGIGRGYYPLADAEACNREVEKLLGLSPGFDGICIAPESPDDPPIYRKPSPRYIHEMMEKHQLDPAETWMVGDKESDVEAGLRAGVRCARIVGGCGRAGVESGVATYDSVAAFVEDLLGGSSEAGMKSFRKDKEGRSL